MQKENYTLIKVIESQNATVRVFSPILTAEERAKRLKQIHKAAARLLKSVTK